MVALCVSVQSGFYSDRSRFSASPFAAATIAASKPHGNNFIWTAFLFESKHIRLCVLYSVKKKNVMRIERNMKLLIPYGPIKSYSNPTGLIFNIQI